jgi:hypothetical protein
MPSKADVTYTAKGVIILKDNIQPQNKTVEKMGWDEFQLFPPALVKVQTLFDLKTL